MYEIPDNIEILSKKGAAQRKALYCDKIKKKIS